MEKIQRKVASRRGHRAHLTKPNHKMEDIMAPELDAVQRATIAIHREQLEQNRQKLYQLDTEIADLIEKPEDLDLEEEILASEELLYTIAEQICRAKAFLETSRKQQLVELEPTEQSTQTPGGIIATQPSQSATEQAVQSTSAIAITQSPQSAELGSNSPSQGATPSSSMVFKYSSKC